MNNSQKRPDRHRRLRIPFIAVACAAAATLVGAALTTGAEPPASAAASQPMSAFDVSHGGAAVGFVEQEAEAADHTGTLIGPDRVYTHLPSEASGREAVTLDSAGQYVEFTLTKPANAMTLRYSVPDNSAGTGITGPVEVDVDGSKADDLSLTSKYSWYYGGYPFSNSPGAGNPHHFYDDVRTMFDSTLPAGSTVRITATSASPTATIDLADFEKVADPISAPSGALNVVDYGADSTGDADSTSAFQDAVDAGQAQGKTVYIPAGTFKLTDHVIVDDVTLTGAGPWYSVLTGRSVTDSHKAAGIYGKDASAGGSSNVTLSNFAIIGEITERVDADQVNAIGGALSDSTVDNVWMQHTKCGAWMDGPMDNLTIKNSRILDMTADGVNFHQGVTNSTVTNTFVRNSGDDGLAMWAQDTPNVADTFSNNTVEVPVLANNIAIYGGKNINVTDNVLTDTVTNGGGIHVGNRYPGVNSGSGTAVSGTFTLSGNTMIRAGNSDYNWQFGVGAIWFDALNEDISGATINVSDTDIVDSSYEAIQFIEGSTTGVHFDDVRIDGTGTFALQLQGQGGASFDGVTATGIGYSNPIYDCQGPDGFVITRGSGNSGWYTDSPYCGNWPDPVYDGGNTSPTPTDSASPTTSPTGNLAEHASVTASHSDVYVPDNAVDGNANSYWESANNAFPQKFTVDLGSAQSVSRLVLKLPPSADWATRTQTLTVSGSTDNSSYSTLAGSHGYTFTPSADNTVTIAVDPATVRYLRLTFTANTGWPAGQLSELEAYAS